MLRRIKMKKFWVVFTCLLLSVVLLSGTVIAIAADENSVIKAGEMVDGDFITGGVAVLN
jgi:hypothetical protein